jgi:hypothetical protein
MTAPMVAASIFVRMQQHHLNWGLCQETAKGIYQMSDIGA